MQVMGMGGEFNLRATRIELMICRLLASVEDSWPNVGPSERVTIISDMLRVQNDVSDDIEIARFQTG